jgi:hypothetical protein
MLNTKAVGMGLVMVVLAVWAALTLPFAALQGLAAALVFFGHGEVVRATETGANPTWQCGI